MPWRKMLAYLTGSVDQELLLRNEFLAAENKILRCKINGRLLLTDPERITLARIGRRLGRKALEGLSAIVQPDTILAWHRRLVAKKFDGSARRKGPGRPRVPRQVEELVLRIARENRSWGYDRVAGVVGNLGYEVADETVRNILQRNGLPPAPERKKGTTWAEFIASHRDVLAAADLFTTEVWTLRGLVTYYVLFFLDLASRKVHVAGLTPHPHQGWMKQIARNVTMEGWGFLANFRFLIHDRDGKFCPAFRRVLGAGGVSSLLLPARSPNLNAFAERWVRSVKEECLAKLILFGEGSLRRALDDYVAHYHHERNHQGKGNAVLAPRPEDRIGETTGPIHRRKRLGGLLNFYYRRAG
ncbi:MAG: helix-turn-helix domain-containing protein [Planctomycetota bacterium]|jgi:transposase InsO family protein